MQPHISVRGEKELGRVREERPIERERERERRTCVSQERS